ncbi:hypothetical protein AAF712_008345 [Marasmius tenuissimus]|uniref:Homeobox domain-containing protein n=1 Tax=Marasmius tenuissimus TaxID=585030 RepID=A0ABR2ZWK2_9AGAR
MKAKVGHEIGLSSQKVQVWFQNQRQKARRQYATKPNMLPTYQYAALLPARTTNHVHQTHLEGSRARDEHWKLDLADHPRDKAIPLAIQVVPLVKNLVASQRIHPSPPSPSLPPIDDQRVNDEPDSNPRPTRLTLCTYSHDLTKPPSKNSIATVPPIQTRVLSTPQVPDERTSSIMDFDPSGHIQEGLIPEALAETRSGPPLNLRHGRYDPVRETIVPYIYGPVVIAPNDPPTLCQTGS